MTIWNEAITEISKIIYKGEIQSRLILASMISRGHVLIEDKPGTGKTKLSKIISTISSLETNRIQCTVDMLPTDIIGFEFYDQKKGNFTFRKGPIFTNILLADELNRASPKSQSALLQAMEEKLITIQNNSFKLPEPFVVIATQNPQEQHGTFPLPESQLDRFNVSFEMPILEFDQEMKLSNEDNKLKNINLDFEKSNSVMKNIKISESLLIYIKSIVEKLRNYNSEVYLSTRYIKHLFECTKAHALIEDRNYAIPDDFQNCFIACTLHRLKIQNRSKAELKKLLNEIIEDTPIV